MAIGIQSPEEQLHDALIAAEVFAMDPTQLGGMVITAHAGPVRSRYLEFLRSCLALDTPFRKLPLAIQDERLLGGLDLAATLQAGRPVLARGLLAEVHQGVLLVAMAERMSAALAARLAGVMDRRQVVIAREGLSAEIASTFGLLLLDESVADDERIAPELIDRLAFQIDLRHVALRELEQAIDFFQAARIDAPAMPICLSVQDVQEVSDEITAALCASAMALGISSIRAAIFARRVAEAAGRWAGHDRTTQEDAALAARLVLAPRATQWPDTSQAPAEEEPPAEPPPQQADLEDRHDDAEQPDQPLENLDDVILESAKAAIPAGLLAQLLSNQRLFARSSGSGKSGVQKKASTRGRPLGSRQGLPQGRARLSIIDTLRAAAPWQKVRSVTEAKVSPNVTARPKATPNVTARPKAVAVHPRLKIRSEDFRIKRFKEKSETTTIFVVDASGSSAIHRLAEAKGAVELLLADCYVRRDQVAVIAFRGKAADSILPPTRSLVRAKRGLSGLPGGGGTPLALAIEASVQLAMSIARKGETPLVVMLTDGKANIARDGNPGREQASRDALAAADQFALSGVAAMLIDTSPQPSPAAQLIAQRMHARYMPLPHAGAAQVNSAIRSMHA